MARILDCWELGDGLAYIEGMSVGSKLMAKAGHEVHFAARDLGHAERLLGPAGIPYYQAPTNVLPLSVSLRFPATFADLLINQGFGTAGSVIARVKAWRQLLDQVKPDILRGTNSPSALMAARGTGIRVITQGLGFQMPPPVSPLPLLRRGPKTDIARVTAREQAVIGFMNQALDAIKAPRIANLGALYMETDERLLWTIPQLDEYGPREGVRYLGNYQPGRGAAPVWPSTHGKRVFAYMERFKQLPEVLAALAASGQPVLVYLPHAPEELKKLYATGNLAIVDQPLDLIRTAQECDLGVSRGGHNIVSTFLYAGKPQLMVPLLLPEHTASIKLQNLGVGLRVAAQQKEIGAGLARLLAEPAFTEKARSVGASVAGLSMEAGVKLFLELVDKLAKAGPRK